MDTQAFLAGMAGVLEMGVDEISDQTALTPDRWDSMAILGAIALIDEQCGVTVPTNELSKCVSIEAIMALVRRTQADGVPS